MTKTDINEAIGKAIKRERKAHHLTQEQLAAKVGISRPGLFRTCSDTQVFRCRSSTHEAPRRSGRRPWKAVFLEFVGAFVGAT